MELLWIHDCTESSPFRDLLSSANNPRREVIRHTKESEQSDSPATQNTPQKGEIWQMQGYENIAFQTAQPAHKLFFFCKCSRLMMGNKSTQRRSTSFYLHCWASLYQIQCFPSVCLELFAHTKTGGLNNPTTVQTSLHLNTVCVCKKQNGIFLFYICSCWERHQCVLSKNMWTVNREIFC